MLKTRRNCHCLRLIANDRAKRCSEHLVRNGSSAIGNSVTSDYWCSAALLPRALLQRLQVCHHRSRIATVHAVLRHRRTRRLSARVLSCHQQLNRLFRIPSLQAGDVGRRLRPRRKLHQGTKREFCFSSLEIEKTLLAHPDVYEAAVIPVPDEKWGEVPKALVVLKPEAKAAEGELLEFCRSRLAHFKCPRPVTWSRCSRRPAGPAKVGRIVAAIDLKLLHRILAHAQSHTPRIVVGTCETLSWKSRLIVCPNDVVATANALHWLDERLVAQVSQDAQLC